MKLANKKPALLLLVVIAILLRVYSIMSIDWTTIELNEAIAPFALLVNIGTLIFILRLKKVE